MYQTSRLPFSNSCTSLFLFSLMHFSFMRYIHSLLLHRIYPFFHASQSCMYHIRYVALIFHSRVTLISHSCSALTSRSCVAFTHRSCISLVVWNIPDQSIFLAFIKTSTQDHVQKIAIHASHLLIVHALHSLIIHVSYTRSHAH